MRQLTERPALRAFLRGGPGWRNLGTLAKWTRLLAGGVAFAGLAATTADGASPDLDGAKLTQQSREYHMTVELPDGNVDLTSTMTWAKASREGREVWQVSIINDSSLGRMVEQVFLRRADLHPLHRSVEQGEVRLAMDYLDGAVRGTASFPDGQVVPIDVALTENTVGHVESAMAVLPLAPEFAIALSTFEPTMQMERHWEVRVAGVEALETALGVIETYRIELTDAEAPGAPGLYWVTQASPHHTVKSASTLPDMFGGGQVTAMLQSVSRAVAAP